MLRKITRNPVSAAVSETRRDMSKLFKEQHIADRGLADRFIEPQAKRVNNAYLDRTKSTNPFEKKPQNTFFHPQRHVQELEDNLREDIKKGKKPIPGKERIYRVETSKHYPISSRTITDGKLEPAKQVRYIEVGLDENNEFHHLHNVSNHKKGGKISLSKKPSLKKNK